MTKSLSVLMIDISDQWSGNSLLNSKPIEVDHEHKQSYNYSQKCWFLFPQFIFLIFGQKIKINIAGAF